MGDCARMEQRKNLLGELKNMVDNMPSSSVGPVIEIYDPLPKACLPICSPGGNGNGAGGGGQSVFPPPSAPVPILPPSCPPPSPAIASQNTVCVPPILPICTPVNPPCIPIMNPNPEEQPCVPCNPPSMMVCYRKPNPGMIPLGKRSKSKELIASKLVNCDCDKHFGLQDSCPRSECQGSPECLTHPPVCGPYLAKMARISGCGNQQVEIYQCYPAYIKLPSQPAMSYTRSANGNENEQGGGSPLSSRMGMPPPGTPSSVPPCVPLIAQAPCPPPISIGPPPLVPVGQVIPMCCPMPPCCPCPC